MSREQTRLTIALFLPSLAGGGAERVYSYLAGRFAGRGHQVFLVLASASGPYASEVDSRVQIVDLNANGVLRSARRLTLFLRKVRPDVLLSALDHANVIAALATRVAGIGNRCVVSVRSVLTAVNTYDPSLRRRILLWLTRLAFRQADSVIANSEAIGRDLAESFAVPDRKLRVIYNPLDVERIEKESAAAAPGAPRVAKGTALVLAVGSLTLLKDFATLIRAFSEARKRHPCRLVILGEGEKRAELSALIADLELGDAVSLPGFDSNPFAWMSAADVLVSSSLTEGCPNVVLQAMACNLPIVATDCVGGTAELLEHGKWGELVPVGDSEAMASAICSVLQSGPTKNLIERAREFSPDKIERAYFAALENPTDGDK